MTKPNQKSNKTDDEKLEQRVRDNIFAGVQPDRPLTDPKVVDPGRVEDWEKEFDEEWENLKSEMAVVYLNSKPMKDFISQQILKAKREVIEKVINILDNRFVQQSDQLRVVIKELKQFEEELG